MKSLKESLIGNIKRTSGGSNLSNTIKTLNSPEVLSSLTEQCIKFGGTVDTKISVPVIKLDKDGKYIRFIFAEVKGGVIQFELDWDKWERFKLPKRIEISNYANSARFYKAPLSAGIIRSQKGVVEGLDIQAGDDKNLRIFFENGLIFKNCIFNNEMEFNILSKADFSKPDYYLGVLNKGNVIYNQLTGNYKENNLGFTWNHLKPVEIFKNCDFKQDKNVFPLYYQYKKEQVYGTNTGIINRKLRKILKPDMISFEMVSRDMHMKEI